MSIVTPVKKQLQCGRAFNFDLCVSSISEFIKSMTFGNSGQMILLSQDNTIVGAAQGSACWAKFSELGATGVIDEET